MSWNNGGADYAPSKDYRKASSPSGAFPAGLQDALAAYCYLVDRLGFECKNIILLGDSAGAGLCVSLVLYLSMLAHVGQRGLARPGKVLLFSPWCDFTVPRDILEQSGEGRPFVSPLARSSMLTRNLRQPGKLDIIDFEGMLLERQAYLQHLPSTLPENDRQGWAKRASDETNELGAFAHQLTKTISILGASHPLISPGMPKSMSAYTERALQLLQSDEDEVGFFICAGGVDVHVNEARSLANNLADLKGVQVEYLEGQDKISSFPFVTSSVANATVDEKIHAFLAIS